MPGSQARGRLRPRSIGGVAIARKRSHDEEQSSSPKKRGRPPKQLTPPKSVPPAWVGDDESLESLVAPLLASQMGSAASRKGPAQEGRRPREGTSTLVVVARTISSVSTLNRQMTERSRARRRRPRARRSGG